MDLIVAPYNFDEISWMANIVADTLIAIGRDVEWWAPGSRRKGWHETWDKKVCGGSLKKRLAQADSVIWFDWKSVPPVKSNKQKWIGIADSFQWNLVTQKFGMFNAVAVSSKVYLENLSKINKNKVPIATLMPAFSCPSIQLAREHRWRGLGIILNKESRCDMAWIMDVCSDLVHSGIDVEVLVTTPLKRWQRKLMRDAQRDLGNSISFCDGLSEGDCRAWAMRVALAWLPQRLGCWVPWLARLRASSTDAICYDSSPFDTFCLSCFLITCKSSYNEKFMFLVNRPKSSLMVKAILQACKYHAKTSNDPAPELQKATWDRFLYHWSSWILA